MELEVKVELEVKIIADKEAEEDEKEAEEDEKEEKEDEKRQ